MKRVVYCGSIPNIADEFIMNNELPKVQAFINELLNSIEVTTGPCHTEVKIDDENDIRLIEIASRSGLLRDRLIRAADGEEYNNLILDSYLGNEIASVELPKTNALLGIIAYESDFAALENARNDCLIVDSHLNGFGLAKKPSILTDAVGYYFIRSAEVQILDNYKVRL